MSEIQWRETLKVKKIYNVHRFIITLTLTRLLGTKEARRTLPDDGTLFPTPKSDKADMEYLKTHFFEEGKLTEAQVLRIVRSGTALLKKEANLLIIDTPATSKNTCNLV